jgi:hypothetical protein
MPSSSAARPVWRRRPPTARERRERLDLLERETRAVLSGNISRCRALALLLARTGGGGLPVVDDVVELRLKMVPLADPPRAELQQLLEQIAAARGALDRSAPPVSGDGALRAWVYDLARIWREATGRRPGRGRSGPFARFLEDVSVRAGVLTGNPDGERYDRRLNALLKLNERRG